jgi:hypothetical protein
MSPNVFDIQINTITFRTHCILKINSGDVIQLRGGGGGVMEKSHMMGRFSERNLLGYKRSKV